MIKSLRYRRMLKEEYPTSYLRIKIDIREKLKKGEIIPKGECKNDEDIIKYEIPEPNFTKVLQGMKMDKVCNVYSDDWGSVDEILYGVHIRLTCKGARLKNKSVLQYFKGENAY